MVSPALPRYRYAVDAQDAIVSVSPQWLAFARENGAPHLTSEAVTGRCLWDFIDGRETRRFYEIIVQRIRDTERPMVVPFRCDSPKLKRYMRLEIMPQPNDGIQFDSILERVESIDRLNLLDPDLRRSRQMLTLCSCCKRALIESQGWVEIEDAAVRLHLLKEDYAPQLRGSVCPDCLAAAHVPPANCVNPANSLLGDVHSLGDAGS